MTIITRPIQIDPNEIYNSNNYGKFRIITDAGYDKDGRRKVLIKFIDTDYESIVLLSNARKGNVKDATIKPIRSIDGFSNEEKEKFIINKLRIMWHSMVNRCTNPNHKEYYAYGAKGISIDESWLDFDTFLYDCTTLFQYDLFINDPYAYQLDKDYLQMNIPKYNRIYSKETCVFISIRDNNNLRAIEYAKTHQLTSKYFGVYKNYYGKYIMGITCNGRKLEMSFDDEIAAANAYNYWFEKLHLYDIVKLVNDVPFMDIPEWVSHMTNRREMINMYNY